MALEAENHSAEEGRNAQATLGALLEQVVPVVARAHQSEAERLRRSPQQRRAALIRRLLKGERVPATGIGYEFDAWHTGLIVTSPGASEATSHLARSLGRRVLSVEHDDITAWAWLGGVRPVAATEIEHYVHASSAPVAVGEPAFGLLGWRMTHRQAQEAHRVALLAPQAVVTTYADVGVLAPWALDRAAALAFIQTHVGPLNEMKGGGVAARQALREIFRASHQIAPAASALRVDRGTLRNRLSEIERRLGFPIASKQAELEIALRLEALYNARPA